MACTYTYGMYTWVHQGRTMDTPRNALMDMDMGMDMDMDKMDMDVP